MHEIKCASFKGCTWRIPRLTFLLVREVWSQMKRNPTTRIARRCCWFATTKIAVNSFHLQKQWASKLSNGLINAVVAMPSGSWVKENFRISLKSCNQRRKDTLGTVWICFSFTPTQHHDNWLALTMLWVLKCGTVFGFSSLSSRLMPQVSKHERRYESHGCNRTEPCSERL